MRRPLAQASGLIRSEGVTALAAALLLACTLLLGLGAAQAQAVAKGTIQIIGGSGIGAGEFSAARGVAVNHGNGHVYVVDAGNHRIQEFDALGIFVRAWGWGVRTGADAFEVCPSPGPCLAGDEGGAAGQLADPQGIAVDQDTGDLYVSEQGNLRVSKFEPDGDFMFAVGWGVDTNVLALEKCTTATTCQAGRSGGAAGQFANIFTGHLAVDPSNGDVVVADPGNRRVQRFDSTGAFRFAFGWGVDTNANALQTCTTASTCQAGRAGSGLGQFSNDQPVRVAVDPAGAVYTVEASTAVSGNRRVQKFNAAAGSAGLFAPDHTSGADTEAGPTNVAVHPTTDHVLVAKDRQILELNVVGDLIETHAPGGALPAANGIAVAGGVTDRFYVTADDRVFVLGQVNPPSATIAPATAVSAIGATGATFHGTVNPNGGNLSTGYHFEYSDDNGLSWTPVPASDVELDNGTTPHQVSQAATGLEPNTDYRMRLVARRPFAGGSATSAETNFRTLPGPPAVSDAAAREVTDTGAVLTGRVDPNRSPTTYRFEYGTDATYGSTTPGDSAGSGPSRTIVTKPISGLQPNTTYHFRLVATNPSGTTAGPDQTFTTAAGPSPNDRAYEMVSPVDKNGGGISRDLAVAGQLGAQTGVAASGDAAAYLSRVTFGDADSGAVLSVPHYLARRTESGWVTEGIVPPVGGVDPTGTEDPYVSGLALDAGVSFGVSGASLTPGSERLNRSWGLYLRRHGQPASQRYSLISNPLAPLGLDSSNFRHRRFELHTSTPDLRRVVFDSSRALVAGAPDAGNSDRLVSVYEWVDGAVRLVSVPRTGESFNTASGTTGAGAGQDPLSEGNLRGDHVLSDDGRRVFFSARSPGGTPHLWVREDGQRTRLVSGVQPPGGDPFAGSVTQFWSARSTDGAVAFFTSSEALTGDTVLTPGEGPALYRWDASADDGQGLEVLSRDSLGTPRVFGPTAVSDDATTVYFVALGVLVDVVPGRPNPIRDQPNLYVWRDGEMHFITTLDGTDASDAAGLDSAMWRQRWENIGGRAARTSLNGDRLLFASYADLDPNYDTVEDSPEACGDPESGGDRCRQIYLYDATTNETTCLSCVPGAPMLGDANLFGNGDPRRAVGAAQLVDAPLELPRNLSTDGRRAFFETARPLVTADRNQAVDVYEWADVDLDGTGELRLISPGRGDTDSEFLGASATGDDVFFTTRERLVGIDTDNQVDLYDARVGGGIAAQNPPPAPPPCAGEQCQGATTGAPFLAGIGSGGASNGNARPGPRPSFSVRRLSRAQKARLTRGRPVSLRVRVNRRGRVSVTARARIRGRLRRVDGSSVVAGRARVVRPRLELSEAALRELARRGRLVVRLNVRFTGVRERRAMTIRLRRTPGTGEGRSR
jgi:NHL repeat